MSLQNKYHIQVHFWLPKIENNFTMPKPSSVSKLSFLWKVAKRCWDILQIIIGQVFPSVPFKGVQNILQIIIEQVKAFLPFLSVYLHTTYWTIDTDASSPEEERGGLFIWKWQ